MVIIGTARLRVKRGADGQADSAPIRVPKANPSSTETIISPMVHGMALPMICPTRAG